MDLLYKMGFGIFVLILIGYFLRFPDAVVNEFRAAGGFVLAETKQLQMA